jgi:hypothetical protein
MEDQRRDIREPRLKTGKIVFNNRNSTMDCKLKNLSLQGAKLNCVNTLGLPEEFEIQVPGAIERRWARKVWQRYDEIGIELL